ncbi:uncharacterized protein LOC119071723 [Bradysia coprophila]|uniref:uncharacterized protein LOC119071723 n=1 Tax=Bradysia coprophila TaxID=38358 RepID=UPI00187D8278|nr:uncharacterized protein LOC119071723 [Bradysia coprophila]
MIVALKISLHLLPMIATVVSQERCISEKFLANENSVFFSCDFPQIKKNIETVSSEYQCVHFVGLPNKKVCGEVGVRFELFAYEYVNASISIRYFSNTNGESKYESIETNGKYGWNHWSKEICADFVKGMNLYLKSSLTLHLDRILLFIHQQPISSERIPRLHQPLIQVRHNTCNDTEKDTTSLICDPAVQYFGWKVTAIILMIVTVGSLILVISLSLTMPYNVWDKPKIQMLPVRLTDGAVTAN